jgi:ubiquinone/menaquinone biosynthesis C-methylase UbiE
MMEPSPVGQSAQNPALEASNTPAPTAWEVAYQRFETPEEEIRKFVRRLRKLGANQWPRNAEIVELFCGRGNGLRALQRLGFERLAGMDLSDALLAQYRGPARMHRGDCRHLPFPEQSKDVIIVQGGLHHLSTLPDDLHQVFTQIQRVLRKNGRVVIVEPWSTPFLKLVHWISAKKVARRCSTKLDAFQTMFEHEQVTYEQWLRASGLILTLARAHFSLIHESFAWGKWNFVGTPR